MIGQCAYGYLTSRAPEIQTAQLDGSGDQEDFYIINGEVAPVRIDGIPSLDYLIQRSE